jgi:hypothetical protein
MCFRLSCSMVPSTSGTCFRWKVEQLSLINMSVVSFVPSPFQPHFLLDGGVRLPYIARFPKHVAVRMDTDAG